MIKRINGISFPHWCVEVLESDEYVLLDTETTGLSSDDQVVELAIINAQGNILYDSLLKPSCPIGEGAMSVHRITEEMVSTSRTFLEAWPDIERAIGGRNIITWNAAFDARMLVQTAMAHKIILKDIDFFCAMQEYQRYYNFSRWQKLTDACAQQAIAFNQSHRALSDTFMVLQIIRAMAEKAMPPVNPSAILGLRDSLESETTMARFQSSDLVPLDLRDWDDVKRRLEQ